jgi:hypothetical protein
MQSTEIKTRQFGFDSIQHVRTESLLTRESALIWKHIFQVGKCKFLDYIIVWMARLFCEHSEYAPHYKSACRN